MSKNVFQVTSWGNGIAQNRNIHKELESAMKEAEHNLKMKYPSGNKMVEFVEIKNLKTSVTRIVKLKNNQIESNILE